MRPYRSLHALTLVLTAALASAAGAQSPDPAQSQTKDVPVQAPNATEGSPQPEAQTLQPEQTQASPAAAEPARAAPEAAEPDKSEAAADPAPLSTADSLAETPEPTRTNADDNDPAAAAARAPGDAEGGPAAATAGESSPQPSPATQAAGETPSTSPATASPAPGASSAEQSGAAAASSAAVPDEAAKDPGQDTATQRQPAAAGTNAATPDTKPEAAAATPAAKPADNGPGEVPAATDAAAPPAPSSDGSGQAAQSPPAAPSGAPDDAPANAPKAPAAAAVAAPSEPPAPPQIAVATGGGAFAQAYQHAVIEPFSAKTGLNVTEAGTDADSSDVVMLDALELSRRCGAGELVSLEIAELKPSAATSGADVQADFLQGALKPCGIAALAWSNLFVYEPKAFAKRAPQSASDVFDTRRYPGKRALPKDGRGLLEAILVADGVAADEVYTVLGTSDGTNRIVKTLKKLGANIVWYDRISEAVALLRSGEASIAFTSNGHAFTEQARSGPLGLIWDGQVLHASYFAVPKSAKQPEHAKELIAFSANPTQLAGIARQIPYGPMRRSALAGAVGMRHAVTGQELGPYLPTASENMRTAVRFDPVWWEENSARMEAALRIVRVGPPLPTRP